jgi:dipeptidyl aminopeptidase/acylaminoacyl peptidase
MRYSKPLSVFYFLICLIEFGLIAPAQPGANEVAAIPGAWGPQLGPEPSKIAFLWGAGGSWLLAMYDVNDRNIRLFSQDENSSMTSFQWVAENKIACVVWQMTDNTKSLVVVDTVTGARITADVGPFREVSFFPTENAAAFPVSVVLQEASAGGNSQYEYDQDKVGWPDLYSVDIKTGKASLLIKNPGNINGWVCEKNGTPMFAEGTDSGKRLFYRIDPVDRGLRLMASADRVTARCNFYSNSALHDRKYIQSNLTSDTLSLYELMPDGTQRLIYGNEKFDLIGVSLHNSGEPNVVIYIADKTEYHFIGKDDNIIRRIVMHFEGKDIISISTDKEDRVAMVVASDIGGRQKTYYYNSIRNTTILLCMEREQNFEKGGFRTEPFAFKARDGLDISGYVTYPRGEKNIHLPAVVLVHGGPWLRDYARSEPIARRLADWGAAVVRINFRGSTGFGKAFEDAGDKQWGQAMQNDLEDGVAELVKRSVIDGDRVAIMGHSYGGYAAVQGVINAPKLYRCAISISGIFDLYDYMANPPEGAELPIRQAYYKIGDPGLDAEMLRKYSPINNYEKIEAPLLIFRGGKDFRNASIDLKPLINDLKGRGIECGYHVYNNEAHHIVKNDNQQHMNNRILRFLKKHIQLPNSPQSASKEGNKPEGANSASTTDKKSSASEKIAAASTGTSSQSSTQPSTN